jgi:glycosyltransferase involved in cell wall biosynthesis
VTRSAAGDVEVAADSPCSGFAGKVAGLHSRAAVLHVIAPADVGGAESVVRLLAGAQRSLGSRVAVAAIVESPNDANSFLDGLGDAAVDVHPVCVGGREYGRERALVARLCRTLEPDVVHSHGYRTDIIDALHVRKSSAIVSTVHGFTGGALRNRLYQWLQRKAYRRFDAVVAVSSQLGRQLSSSIDRERLHVVANGYEADGQMLSRDAARQCLGLPNDAIIVGWVGRLSREKGPDVLLEAIANAEFPRHVLTVMVGDGPMAHVLKQRAAELGVGARVIWTGRIANAGQCLKAFDSFVLTSRTEGTPMVLLEAMAAAVPIVATRVGGVPEVLPEGTAMLVPAESPARAARAIRDAIANPAASTARAAAARQRVETTYKLTSWADSYEEIYQRARACAHSRIR